MNKYQATIFSTDSDIYTALQSNKVKLSDNSIREIAFNRGVLFSSNIERDTLIEKMSELPFSYSDVVSIQDKLATNTNHEIYSILRIYEGFDVNNLYEVVENVKLERNDKYREESITHSGGLGTYTIEVTYTEYDFRRGKFQQKKLNGGKISFIKSKNFTSVRFTQTKKITSILNDILYYYKAKVLDAINIQHIDLAHISDQKLRNMFAKHLYDFDNRFTLDGFNYFGLEKVRLSRIKTIFEDDTDELNSPPSDLSSDYDGDEEDESSQGMITKSEENKKDEHNRVFRLNNASYDGHSLVDAKQIEELCDEGFYRSFIRWKSRVTLLSNKPIVTFEIGFEDKHFCREIKIRILHKQFSYSGDDKEKIEPHEFDIIIKSLEDRIFNANDLIIEELAKHTSTPIKTLKKEPEAEE
ncbi:hypothetical protein Rahaq_1472 [Rahnella aceris]|uniref:Uncharacterized protein n=1 Tax=Rahnella sp. (strain Y9602) TaxID=2703885 RepID=A0A0H3F859_RAHSY|nr:hypothetical protein [Rahnella aceris]ADW73094.1 hypothetical protein Rahaq_1472 [Rahnella aceris]